MNWEMILEELKDWLDDKCEEKLDAYNWGLANKAWSFSHAANNALNSFEQVLGKLRELEGEYREY